MAKERVQRRLVAILAADVVGYGRLMGEDEEGTLATLKAYREVIDGLIAGHEGRVFGSAGDSVIAEFASAVEAVRCAVNIQRDLEERNADLPDDHRMRFRIGINLGDVMVDGNNLLGDGVNIAARVEGLAEPGGICISGAVFQQVKKRLDLAYEDLGEREVKNIAEPISIYLVRIAKPVSPPSPALPNTRPSIAVLPFENMSGDPEQEYFADGLTEDIITALSLWRSFPVIARHSTFTYKGKSVRVQQVAEELGARYVLEGGVRKVGRRVRITAQLIDAETGHHVWAQKFDRDLEDIFAIQDEVTQRIVAIVEPELERAEQKRSVAKKPTDLDAWDNYQRGMAFLYQYTKKGNRRARKMFARATKLDPSYSQPFIGLAYSHQLDILNEYTESREHSIDKLFVAARQAIALDDKNSMAHLMLGFACRWARKHDMAIAEAKKAVELNPSNAFALFHLGNVLDLAGNPDEGITNMKKGFQFNPLGRIHYFMSVLARAHLNARRYEDAVEWARKAIHHLPDHARAHAILAIGLAHLGRLAEARVALDECERVGPGFAKRWALLRQYRNPADNEHILEGLRKARLAE